MRRLLESCLGLASLVTSFVGSYLLLLWGCWCVGWLLVIALALVRGTSGLPWVAPEPGATTWVWTALGLFGAVTKRGGDRVARWVYRDALTGAGSAERAAPVAQKR